MTETVNEKDFGWLVFYAVGVGRVNDVYLNILTIDDRTFLSKYIQYLNVREMINGEDRGFHAAIKLINKTSHKTKFVWTCKQIIILLIHFFYGSSCLKCCKLAEKMIEMQQLSNLKSFIPLYLKYTKLK